MDQYILDISDLQKCLEVEKMKESKDIISAYLFVKFHNILYVCISACSGIQYTKHISAVKALPSARPLNSPLL